MLTRTLTEIMFPLYEEIEKSDVKATKTWTQYCSIIYQLSEKENEIILLLILHHYNTRVGINENNKQKLPYRGKVLGDVGKSVFFQLKYLPIELQNIIAKYITIITE